MRSWPTLRAAHEVVVRRDDARGDEDVLLERRVGGDVRLGLDLRQRADRRVVLDERAAPEDDVVADRHALAHARLVAEDHARTDRACRRTRSRRSRRSCRRRSRSAAADRAWPWSAARATAAFRRPRSRAPSRPLRAPCPGTPSRSGGCQLPFSEIVSMSSARTTRAPSVRDLPDGRPHPRRVAGTRGTRA